MYLHKAEVSGDNPKGILEMFQYDSCYPADVDSAIELESALKNNKSFTIRVAKMSHLKHNGFSGQWRINGFKLRTTHSVKL